MNNIETNRLRLRNFKETDAQGYLEYNANPRVNCFMSHTISDLEAATKEVQKKINDDAQIAVCLKDSDTIIGDLFCMKEDPDTFCIGWNFNASYEGKGYASESAQALLHYLFEEKGARRLYAYVEDDNFRSQKLSEKLGMRREGCFMEFISFVKNEDGTPKYENTYQYALLKKEWLQQKMI